MKKLILSALLIAASSFAFSQTNPDSLLVKVCWVDNHGTQVEKSAEVKARKMVIEMCNAKQFAFVATKENPKGVEPGKYLLFIKSGK